MAAGATRAKQFGLSAAVGESRSKKNGAGNREAETHEPLLDEGERAERLAEVAHLLKLGISIVEAGEGSSRRRVGVVRGR
jgi:hypothetical protein